MSSVYHVRIVSAATADMLTAAIKAHISLCNVQSIDELTITAQVDKAQYPALLRLLQKRGEHCDIHSRSGLYWVLLGLLHRPVLIVCFLLLLIVSLYLPSRVLFVEVEGNSRISAYQILEKAEDCGIRMWASRANVRSEKMKNSLLKAIPELKWAGINTKGCVAVISVTEREVQPVELPSLQPKRIVAMRDGVVEQLTVTKGTAICAVGQAVTQGQVLVSPYTDCGISLKITEVEGEILARTNRNVCLVKPLPSEVRADKMHEEVSVSILFGKNKINLYNGSGNCSAVCDKIYMENYVTLPGGFQLPIALVTERSVCYHTASQKPDMLRESSDMKRLAEGYLQTVMVSGKILSGKTDVRQLDDCMILEGKYSCLEMIGKLQNEEVVQNEQRS